MMLGDDRLARESLTDHAGNPHVTVDLHDATGDARETEFATLLGWGSLPQPGRAQNSVASEARPRLARSGRGGSL